MFLVQMEAYALNDLPVQLEDYLEWASNWNYYVEVTDASVTTFNQFHDIRDAKLYALSHGLGRVMERDVVT